MHEPRPTDCNTENLIRTTELMDRVSLMAEMQQIAPPGQQELDDSTMNNLRVITQRLLETDGENAIREYERFKSVEQRELNIDRAKLNEHLKGKNILVTGGTGCIGSALLKELDQFDTARVVSLSLDEAAPEQQNPNVEYRQGDIRDDEELGLLFDEVKPDIVYHLAAQRDPSFAESDVAGTLSTNITGTRNIIKAAETHSTPQVVYASTGKALRPFTPDTYAASKKASESLLAEVAQESESTIYSGVRFTHVVDNSIIHQRLQDWIKTDRPIRLHGSDILFYMQSARESAHLLLNSGLEAEKGTFTLQAIKDLEWPINLVDLALGAVAESGKDTPIYICGFESGYEEKPYPGLYDPLHSGELSPLINTFEASETAPSISCPQVDRFPYIVGSDPALDRDYVTLEYAAAEGAPPEVLHEAKDRLSWSMLDARLRKVPQNILQRTAKRMERTPSHAMNEEHVQTNNAVNRRLKELGE